jgi:F-type H+-transporting ATPase subunit b
MELLHDQEFWFAVAFVIFVATMWKPAKKALTSGLDVRVDKARSDLAEARRLREEAQALIDLYHAKQQQAVKDAAEILSAAKDEAERMRREGEEELKRNLAAREAQAMDRIALAEQDAIRSVRIRAVDIAIKAATGLVADAIDKDGANALVDNAIDDLPKRAHA